MVDVHRLYTFTKEFQNLTQRNQYQLQFFYTEINDIDHSTADTHTKTEREVGFRLRKQVIQIKIIALAILA